MIVLGAGGHAKEVIEILISDCNEAICMYDDINPERDLFLGKYRVLHSLDELRRTCSGQFTYCVAVGSPSGRRQLWEKFDAQGGTLVSVIAPSAVVSENDVEIGVGCNIMHQCFIGPSVRIGTGCLLNQGCGVHHDCEVGDFCEIGPGAQLLGHACMGHNVMIGAGSTILSGVVIGDDAVVGAGAVVTRDVSSRQTVAGVPAHVLAH